MKLHFRKAQLIDELILEDLIQVSAKAINKKYYTSIEIEAALGSAWTVDKQLIIDQTYWIVENDESQVVGCGGWSKRKLLFGKNDELDYSEKNLIPISEPAKIRAFFVHPDYTRLGIGKKLLTKCEMEAHKEGYRALELVATLSGEKLYTSNGYEKLKSYTIDVAADITNEVVSMYKKLSF